MKLTAADLTRKVLDIISKIEPNPQARLTLRKLERIALHLVVFFIGLAEKAKAAGDRI